MSFLPALRPQPFVRALVVLGAAFLALLALSAPASAATSHPDGSDPASTGCASGAYTARSAYIRDSHGTAVGLIELRYSPACATAWGRITTIGLPACTVYDDFCGFGEIHRTSDGRTYDCPIPKGGHGCYTKQVNDSRVVSYAHGSVDEGPVPWQASTGTY